MTCKFTEPIQLYIDYERTKTANAVNQMTLLNLTNGAVSLVIDIALLNSTYKTINYTGYFWYSSSFRAGLVANVNVLEYF